MFLLLFVNNWICLWSSRSSRFHFVCETDCFCFLLIYNLRQKKFCAAGIWWAARIIDEIDMTSIEELFLSRENAYPHAERAFRKYYWDWKAVEAKNAPHPHPTSGIAVLVCRVLLPPAACKRPQRGCHLGLAAVGHQVSWINILWANRMFYLWEPRQVPKEN